MITASVALLLSLAVTNTKLCAQDTPPAAAAPAAAAPAAPAAPAAAPAPAADAAPAAAPTGPSPSLDQRVGILEAYLTNSDPTVPLK
ncbi:MAG: hypothetical protein P4L99_16915, partial [Chthoniobacter sp.]|nr:hypothetical protein [Chthoniobacter sp.]